MSIGDPSKSHQVEWGFKKETYPRFFGDGRVEEPVRRQRLGERAFAARKAGESRPGRGPRVTPYRGSSGRRVRPAPVATPRRR